MPRLFPRRCFFFSSHGESFGSIDFSFSCKLINIDSDDRRLLSFCSGCRMSVITSLWPMSSTKNHKNLLQWVFLLHFHRSTLLVEAGGQCVEIVQLHCFCWSSSICCCFCRFCRPFSCIGLARLLRLSLLLFARFWLLSVCGCWSWSWLLWLGDDVTEF